MIPTVRSTHPYESGSAEMKKPKMKKRKMKNPCWKGYEAYGMKNKNGRMVPNCGKKK